MNASAWSAITWDVARAGGLMAYALLSLSVALGLLLSLRWQRPRWPRLITNELHSFVTLLTLAFMALHGLGLLLDPYMRFSWQELFVPLMSHYRPLWTALGIVGLYLAVAVWISSQLRPHIGYTLWRRLHVLTFAAYALSTVHGIATGTDTRQPWALGLYAASLLVVGALLCYRLLIPIGTRGRAYPRLAGATALLLAGVAAWTVTGPARPGWNAVANSGQGAGERGPSAVQSGTSQTAAVPVSAPFTAQLQGSVTQTSDGAGGAVTLRWATMLGDGSQRTLTVTVQGEPAADGSMTVTSTRVTLGGGANGASYTGTLSALRGGWSWRMAAALTANTPGASRLSVRIALQQVGDGGQVSGTLSAAPLTSGATPT